jgi:excisionase family DNA binding protein
MTSTTLIRLDQLTGEELVDSRVAAKILGLSIRTVGDMASRRELPLYKIGRSVRFKVNDLYAWRESRRIACAMAS